MKTGTIVKDKIRSGSPTIGSWLQIPSIEVAQILAGAGYDWLAVDMEHGGFSRKDLHDIISVLEHSDTLPFVRVADHTMSSIKSALDAGAKGLIFPMIESRKQLDEAIDLALYPPLGKRGVGYCRGNKFGKDFDKGLKENQETYFCAQIEHISAIDQLDKILAHPRLDAVMVGPYDFSGSMGLTGQFDHPDFIAAIETISKMVNQTNVAMGIHIVQPDPNLLQTRIAEGYRFIAYGIDALFLYQSSQCPELNVESLK